MTQPRLLGNRYQLGDTLGYGGMAEVHRGRDVRLGREVAVKVLRADLARDPSFQIRFRREAQAAASLNHPAIVAVYDTGEDSPGSNGATPFIVMEYVEGRTLREILKTEGPLHPQRAMEITADICAALDFSHRNHIVHRDVKPGNVMITKTGAVKVMDFGIARALTDNSATVTQTAAVIGTAQYLSPEQARGESVDARSDVYSTGCLLYELLTGNPPFTGDSPVAVAYQHVRENPKPPSSVNSDVPRELDSIVLKSMAKNPLNRYQSAAEMRADLARAIAGRQVQAEPVMSEDERTTVLGSGSLGNTTVDRRGNRRQSEPEPEGRDTRKVLLFVLIGLGLVVAVVLGALWLANRDPGNAAEDPTPPARVTVPNVLGVDPERAGQLLEQEGLEIGNQSSAESSPEQQGLVISSNPEQGTELDRGTQVDITVGTGPGETQVPTNLVGLTQEAAQAALENAGLASRVEETNNSEPAGQVVSTIPESGQRVAEGSEVLLRISTGRVPVPGVRGQTGDQAQVTLNEAGFTNLRLVPTTRDDVEEGTVVDQNPPGGTPIGLLDEIVLTVAEPSETTPAPPTSSRPPPLVPSTPSTSPSPSPSISLRDDD